jgi:hypothetical protein
MDIIKMLRAVGKTRKLSETEFRAFVRGKANEMTPAELRSLNLNAVEPPKPPKVITPAAPAPAVEDQTSVMARLAARFHNLTR